MDAHHFESVGFNQDIPTEEIEKLPNKSEVAQEAANKVREEMLNA